MIGAIRIFLVARYGVVKTVFTYILFIFSYIQGSASVINEVSNLEYRGGTTSTNRALDQARTDVFQNDGDRPQVLNVVIIVTDGVPFPATLRQPTIDAASQLQAIATSFAVGITNSIDEGLLQSLSSQPRQRDQNYFMTPNFDQLEEKLVPLLSIVCPVSTQTPGRHK